jgi:hypothetical protein
MIDPSCVSIVRFFRMVLVKTNVIALNTFNYQMVPKITKISHRTIYVLYCAYTKSL